MPTCRKPCSRSRLNKGFALPRERVVKKIVSDVPTGAVARHKGWWGVSGKWSGQGARRFDRWDAPSIRIWSYEEVSVVEIQQNGRPSEK